MEKIKKGKVKAKDHFTIEQLERLKEMVEEELDKLYGKEGQLIKTARSSGDNVDQDINEHLYVQKEVSNKTHKEKGFHCLSYKKDKVANTMY